MRINLFKEKDMNKIFLLVGIMGLFSGPVFSGAGENDSLPLASQDSLIISSPNNFSVGQPDTSLVSVDDTSQEKNLDYIEKAQIQTNFDSLLNQWYVQTSNNQDTTSYLSLDYNAENDSILSTVPDSVYRERLERIPSVIPLTYNRIVRNYIEMYLYKKRDRVEVMTGLANYYFPLFDDIFDAYGVPTELKYMSVIESALNPQARSRTRAIGLWQFMTVPAGCTD